MKSSTRHPDFPGHRRVWLQNSQCSQFCEKSTRKSVFDKKPFAFVGLWDSWHNIELGDTLETFTIITTTANALIRQIRNRMPVMFDRERGHQWLDPRFGAYSVPLMLVPFPSEFMEAWEVSTSVEFVENDTPECIKSVGGPSATIRPPERKVSPVPIVSPYELRKK